ncbi:tetratricopeptide repeat protein [bacterium]|nr:tetratricopeptide repeat protein [candidate division CSSED10-310 bacterium]
MQSLTVLLILAVSILYYPWTMEVTRIKTLSGIILIGIMLVVYTYTIFRNRVLILSRSFIVYPSVGLGTWMVLSVIWSRYRWTWAPEIARMLPVLVFSVLFAVFATKYTFLERLNRWFAWISIPIALYGFVQILGLDVIPWGRSFGDGVFSTFGHPNILAPFLIMATAAVIYRIWTANKTGMRVFWTVHLAAILACLLLTRSKGALVGLAGAVIFFGCISGYRKIKLSAVVLLGVLVLGLSAAIHLHSKPIMRLWETNQFRIWTWDGAMAILKESNGFRVLIGHGLGTFPVLFPEYRNPQYLQVFKHAENLRHAHCEYLELTVELGLIGLFLFLLIIVRYFINSFRGPPGSHLEAVWRNLAVSAVLAILLHNLVSVNLRWFSSWFVLFLGMSWSRTAPAPAGLSLGFGSRGTALGASILAGSIFLAGAVFVHRQMQSERFYFSGQTSLHWNQPGQAVHSLKHAVEIDPFNLPALYDLAYAYSLTGKTDRSIEIYRKINRINSNYQRLHRNLAIAYHTMGDTTGSEHYYELARDEMIREISINDSDDNRFYMAQLYDLTGQPELAGREYGLFLERILSLKKQLHEKRLSRTGEKIQLVQPHDLRSADSKILHALHRIRSMDPDDYAGLIEKLKRDYRDVLPVEIFSEEAIDP